MESAQRLDAVARSMGACIEHWGFKEVHGRIWLHLYLSTKPLDSGDLISRLKISKALVSISLSTLIEYELVECCGLSEKGRKLYRAKESFFDVICSILKKRELRLLTELAASIDALLQSDPEALNHLSLNHDRVSRLSALNGTATAMLSSIIETICIKEDHWSAFRNSLVRPVE